MDLSPLIVLVVFVALIAFSTRSRMRDDRDGRPGSDLKPPGEVVPVIVKSLVFAEGDLWTSSVL